MLGESSAAATAQYDPKRIRQAAILLREAIALLDVAGAAQAALTAHHALTMIDPSAGNADAAAEDVD